MRRVVNFRPCLFIFAFCAVGVLLAPIAHFLPPLGISLLAAEFAAMAAFGVYFGLRGERVRALTFAAAAAVTAVCVIVFFAVLSSRAPVPGENVNYTISGRLTEDCVHDGGELTATLDDLSADGEPTDGRMRVTITDDFGLLSALSCGDRITFNAAPVASEIMNGVEVNAYAARSDVRYYAYADEEDVYFTEDGEPGVLESARLYVRDRFVDFMGEEIGGISYGMVVGDRTLIPETADEAFSAAGVGHILSVSGLHIGLVALVLTRLAELMRVPYLGNCIAVTVLLTLYTVFTGAAASAVRSLIMFSVAVWARYFGPRDALGGLSAACIVCLLISPFYMFDCGFLMSAGSVWGLTAFSRPLSGALRKLRLPKVLADGLGASLSVQVAILPLTAVFFSEIGLYAVLVNALLMPVLSFVFVLLVCLLPFMLIPPLGFAALIPAAGVGWISALSAATAALPMATLTVKVSALAAAVLPLSLLASRFVLAGNKYLRAIGAVTLSCFLVIASRNGLRSDNALVFFGGSAAVTVALSGNNAAILADWESSSSVASVVSRSRTPQTRFTVYADELTYAAALGIIRFSEDFGVERVVFPTERDMSGVGALVDADISVTAASDTDELSVAYIGGQPRGWLRFVGGKLCFVCAGAVYDEYTDYFDVVRGKTYYGEIDSVVASFTRSVPPLAYGKQTIVE